MRIMTSLFMTLFLAICNNSSVFNIKQENSNVEYFVLNDTEFKEEISVSTESVNIKFYLGNEFITSVIIKVNSFGLESYKRMIIDLDQYKTTEMTKIYYLINGIKVYIKEKDNAKKLIADFDKSITLSEKIVTALKTKATIEVESGNFSKAYKLAELSIYTKQPFYFGAFKDDRSLKIILQKILFDSGKKKEAIINLLAIE